MEWRKRIVADPKVMVGKPVIKGSRITVEFIIDLLANSWSHEQILDNYPGIVEDDIISCLEYAHEMIKDIKEYPILT
jgi:uncharacterized protein (DUF433 family)